MKPIIFLLFTAILSCSAIVLDTEWWKNTVIYEILPYSFKDSDGDGIGDLKGITSKLDHFVDLKIETLRFTPIFKSTFLYDITDYNEIYPEFGTMEDFEELIAEMKKRGMKLILDMVINHSGLEHEWFQKSVSKINPYKNFYVWKDANGFDEYGKPLAPNKWISFFGGSAWKWNEERKQFYLHQFREEQPDFNLSDQYLEKEMKKILKFWLDKGVSGFSFDSVIYFMEDEKFRDDTRMRQRNQDTTLNFIRNLRSFLDDYNQTHGGFERILIAEANTEDKYVRSYYGSRRFPITHYPYNFLLENIDSEINPIQLDEKIVQWINNLPKKAVSLWMTQDHDSKRVGTRIRLEYSDIMTMTSLMLPGAVGCYYGQEIAMFSDQAQPVDIDDIFLNGTPDPNGLIMQWDETMNAGFTSNSEIYLPDNVNVSVQNVEFEKLQQISHYHMFKDLIQLRMKYAFKKADFKTNIPSENIYTFSRSYKNLEFLVVINLGHSTSSVDLNKILKRTPQYVIVSAASVNAAYQKGFEFDEDLLTDFKMTPLSSLVLSVLYWKYSWTEPSPTNIQQTITNKNGESTNVIIKNGVVKVDEKVVYISSESSINYTIKYGKIYANYQPVYDLDKKLALNSTPSSTNKKAATIEVDNGIIMVNKIVEYAGSIYFHIVIKDNNIYSDGQLIYELFAPDVASQMIPDETPSTLKNSPEELQYTLIFNRETTITVSNNGIVNVNGKAIKYRSPNSSMPRVGWKIDKIFIDRIPLQKFLKEMTSGAETTPLLSSPSEESEP